MHGGGCTVALAQLALGDSLPARGRQVNGELLHAAGGLLNDAITNPFFGAL